MIEYSMVQFLLCLCVIWLVVIDTKADLDVRLVDGKTPHDGRVELKYKGEWTTLCAKHWDLLDAFVVCRMLNYLKAVSADSSYFKAIGTVYPSALICSGTEQTVEQCRMYGVTCGPNPIHAAVAVCGNLTEDEKAIRVRLVGINQRHFGRVEIKYQGMWRRICDDWWNTQGANVICRMLGYQAAVSALFYASSVEVQVKKTLLYRVSCSGQERSIAECAYLTWWRSSCNSEHYAGAFCQLTQNTPTVQVRLTGGITPNSGQVEVRYHGVWGTVCSFGWDKNDADVVCRMLGFLGVEEGYGPVIKGHVREIIWLYELGCNGSEMSITNCSHKEWGRATFACSHHLNVDITCKLAAAPQFTINGCTSELTINRTTQGDKERQTIKSYEIRISKLGSSLSWVLISDLISNFTIGDGKYHNCHYNRPLKPGSTYRISMRAVTKAQNEGNGYGKTSSDTFTTTCPTDKAPATLPEIFTTVTETVTSPKTFPAPTAYSLKSARAGALVGIVIGLLMLIVIIVVAVFVIKRRIHRGDHVTESLSLNPPDEDTVTNTTLLKSTKA